MTVVRKKNKNKKTTIAKVLSTWRLETNIGSGGFEGTQRFLNLIFLSNCKFFQHIPEFSIYPLKLRHVVGQSNKKQYSCSFRQHKETNVPEQCRPWLLCTREYQHAAALPYLNRDTSIYRQYLYSRFAPESTVLQRIQKEPGCLLSAGKSEASPVASFL